MVIFLLIFLIAAFLFNVRALIVFRRIPISGSEAISEFPETSGVSLANLLLSRKYKVVVLGPSSTILFSLIAFLTISFSFPAVAWFLRLFYPLDVLSFPIKLFLSSAIPSITLFYRVFSDI